MVEYSRVQSAGQYGGSDKAGMYGAKNDKGHMAHKVILTGRNQGIVTGVNEVIEFDNNVIDLDTSMGRLVIKGKDMKVKGINLEKGEAEIEGSVDSFIYTSRQSNESFIKRMFK